MSNPTISIIAAVAKNRAIGRGGHLLWQIQSELQRFKLLTMGKPVIMGRKTFESIGKPLAERPNIVLTRDTQFAPEGVIVVHSFDEAIAKATPFAVAGQGEIMIIGGATIYEEALPRADKLYLTEVDDTPDGDAFFPELHPSEWQEVRRMDRPHEVTEASPDTLEYAFVDYQRVTPAGGAAD